MIKNITHFKTASQPIVTVVPAGSTPMAIGDITTIHRHTSNKSHVVRPEKFFDAAHMDIAHGDVVAT